LVNKNKNKMKLFGNFLFWKEEEFVGECNRRECQKICEDVKKKSLYELRKIIEKCNKCFEKNYINPIVKTTRNAVSAEYNTRKIKQ